MNVNGTPTPPPSLAVSPEAIVQPRVASNTASQMQPVSGANIKTGIRESGVISFPGIACQPSPPFMPSPSYPGRHTMIGMIQQIQQMLHTLMRMLSGLLSRPQPPSVGFPGRPNFDGNSLIGLHASEAQRRAMKAGVSEVAVIPVGAVRTLEYRPNRLNLQLDRSGRVNHTNWG